MASMSRHMFFLLIAFAKVRFYVYLSSAKDKFAFPPRFWCVWARGKQNPAGDGFKVDKRDGDGDVRDYTICTAAAVVLYDTSTRCTYSSLEPLIPGEAHLVPGTVLTSTQHTIL